MKAPSKLNLTKDSLPTTSIVVVAKSHHALLLCLVALLAVQFGIAASAMAQAPLPNSPLPKVPLSICSLATGTNPACNIWNRISGTARDIGVGADGTAWKIGTVAVGSYGYDIAKWDGSSWVGISGGAVRVDVDPSGNPWVVNAYGRIYRYTVGSQSWAKIPGTATDIGIGGNGDVWKIGTTPVGGFGFDIAKWNGSTWDGVDGGAVRIDVDPQGNLWVANAFGNIYRYTKSSQSWANIPGTATDIGTGANGAVWKTGTSPGNTFGFRISRWNGTGWDAPVDGAAEEISVGPDGKPWVVNLLDAIYRRVLK